MKRIWIGLILIGLVLVAAYAGACWYFSSQIIVYQSVPIAGTDPDTPSDPRWSPAWDEVPPPESVAIQSGDITLAGDFYDNPVDGACAVIVLHGLSGSRRQAQLFGPMFYDLGCDILSYDARAHGDSNVAYLTYGYYEKDDALAVIHWLTERTGLETNQIGLLGQSYGAATALQLLAIEPDVAFVIADSAYQDMKTIITDRANAGFGSWINLIVPGALQMAEFRANFETDAVSAVNAVRGVDTPILLIHSQQDAFTLPSHSEVIYAAANPATTHLILTDWNAEHARSIFADEAAYIAIVYDFLAEYVPDFGNQSV